MARRQSNKNYLKTAKKVKEAVHNLTLGLSSKIRANVSKYSSGDQINDMAGLKKAIDKDIREYTEQLQYIVVKGGGKVASIKADEALKEIRPILLRVGLTEEAQEFRTQLNNYPTDVEQRMPYHKWTKDGRTLEQTIVTIRKGTQKTVLYILENGVREGKSVRELAKQIDQYIIPDGTKSTTRPYDVYRKRFGRAKSVQPKGVPSGSVSYNAVRIARTETAHIYRTASLDFYSGKRWVKGFKWYLSNSHKVRDECDEYASKTYKSRDSVPVSHPNCMCDVRPDLMSMEELRKLQERTPANEASRTTR